MPLTSHERLLRIFQNREIDRPAIKLWGVQANWRNTAPAYHRISRLAAELSDIFVSVGSRL
ncbi:MAG: hypothetical protein IKZ19_08865, partial [Clostridia bacterium]|nr:hypothetical protein [Clostridia bacterium]